MNFYDGANKTFLIIGFMIIVTLIILIIGQL